MDLLNAALSYARMDWPVFPIYGMLPDGRCGCGLMPSVNKGDGGCESAAKHPVSHLVPKGFKDAVTDETAVNAWWGNGQAWNIGIATAGLLVVDIDPRNGGHESFAALMQGRDPLPTTPEAITGSGGRHIFFKGIGKKLKKELCKGVDLKGDGGYVVAAPSRHASGGTYAWELCGDPANIPLAVAPEWLQRMAIKEKKAGKATVEGTTAGRNVALFSDAGSMRRRGFEPPAILAALQIVNATKCTPPLDEAELHDIAYGVGRYAPEPDEQQNTDLGNSRRLVVMHGDTIRYCPEIGWLAWDGRRWSRDADGMVVEKAKDLVETMLIQATNEPDEDTRKAKEKWALKSQERARLTAMIELAKSDPAVVIHQSDLDPDPWALNCLNGIVDLKTGKLKPHDPKAMLSKMCPVAYQENAVKCPVWTSFLERVMQGDNAMIGYLQRIAGYTLTPSVQEDAMFILYGSGANGKTTFVETVLGILGDYATKIPMDALLQKRGAGQGIPNDVAMLRGARMASASESEEGRRLSESTVKSLTSRSRILARFLHKEFFEFQPTHKLWMDTNHKPVIRGDDNGIWRRVHLVPFEVSIPKEQWDLSLADKILAEASAVLFWIVQGCLEWQNVGLGQPEKVEKATDGYRNEMDSMGAFLSEMCVQIPGNSVGSAELYATYKRWSEDNGEHTVSNKRFSLSLEERGFVKKHTMHGKVWMDLYFAGKAMEA